MWILQLFVKLFREIYFDRREEADIRSKHFKPKRFIGFTISLVLAIMCLFTFGRLLMLGMELHSSRAALEKCQATVTSMESKEKALSGQ